MRMEISQEVPLKEDDGDVIQHCLRQLTSVQVRNLTPFPARDALASALTQRPPLYSNEGKIASDDADILLARRRSRKMSSASATTMRSLHSDNSHEDTTPTAPRVRMRTNSRASMQGSGIATSPSGKRQAYTIPAGTIPTIRRRPRTTSQASVTDRSTFAAPSTTAEASTSAYSWILANSSCQKDLEKVIWSRLVETFLTIDLPNSNVPDVPSTTAGPSTSPLSQKKHAPDTGSLSRRVALNQANESRRAGTSSPSSTVRQKRHAATPSISSPTSKVQPRTSSPSPSINGSTHAPSPPTSASPRKITFPHSPPPTPPPSSGSDEPPPPAFISPLHRPSTNPKFVLDPEDHSYAPWADLSSDRVTMRLWGHVGTEWGLCNAKGKGKEKETIPDNPESIAWRVLSSWDVNLSDSVPLPDDLIQHPWKLPANSLILTFGSSNRPYYIPFTLLGVSPAPSRSHSPDYNSDTELAVARPRKPVERVSPLTAELRGRQRKSRKELKSCNWNELVKLVSLQTSLSDTQNLLDQVVKSCNQLIEDDKVGQLRREASQREYRLQVFQEQRDALDEDIGAVRESIQSLGGQLKQRRMNLAEARALHEDDLLTEFDAGAKLADERNRVAALRNQIEPVRTSLLSTLAFIFPIELLSPPDLLFTILNVPLPIPMNGTDPAPPLSLASFSEVNEDSVATALGYAAHLVHLMAAYLCRSLVYPITYIGSRSLIKDPISAMMGPRMFPLYSKGVDTYRFEYAVFLLNKDIEMLMADRNLRALDLRHTLPNLKNLLLTLTSGESALPRSRPLPSPAISSGLQTPERISSPPPLDLESSSRSSPSTTPKLSSKQLPASSSEATTSEADEYASEESSSVTTSSRLSSGSLASSSTTSSMTNLAKKPKSYLGFVPLTSMFRMRYPSSGSKVTVKIDEVPEVSDSSDTSAAVTSDTGVEGTAEASIEDDEDDRRTIRGASTPAIEVGPDDKVGNGCHVLGSESESEKKLGDSAEPVTSTAESVMST